LLVEPTASDIQIDKSNNLKKYGDALVNVNLKSEYLEAKCDVLSRNYKVSSVKKAVYEPTIFIGIHNVTKEHKLELAFVGYMLGKIEGQIPEKGTIVSVDGKSHGLKLKPFLKSLQKIVSSLQDWLSFPTSQPPQIILNKHCLYCQFQKSCKSQAEETDNLSQLSGMNVKTIQRYEKKGIFTIKQLSYLFKPRRLKKQAKNHQQTHKPELRALAIRTGKIYIQELPNFSRQSVELFVDIEGIPDQNLYYLFGLLVYDGSNSTYHPFWADSNSDEAYAWENFIGKIEKYPSAPIYHYGNYELRAIDVLSKRYGGDAEKIKSQLININSQIYGKVYFPVNSNGLKEIGNFIGASWILPNSSGLQSLVWRHNWEITHDSHYKDNLLIYNKDDCLALEVLTDKISKIKDAANILSDIDFVSTPKRNATESGKRIHDHFETILKFAHNNYDEKKIKFYRETEQEEKETKPKSGSKLGYQGQRKVRPKATKTIKISATGQSCPKDGTLLKEAKQISKRLIIDLVLGKNGMKKTITEYIGQKGYCPQCYRYYAPVELHEYGARQLYGHGFRAWVVYQRIGLRMTYSNIAEAIAEQFNEADIYRYVSFIIKDAGQFYQDTEDSIIKKLLESDVIHADETPINIRGATQYVWTFTNDKYVVFKLSKTREATIAHEFLKSFKGILISDFYAGYDAIQCVQQKCWVHLIRELNDDLWDAPFDTEFENLVSMIRAMFVPIMESVQKYGLKRRHLFKFMKQVDQFYEKAITNNDYKSELAVKYQKRFAKHKDSLFIFLQHDGVPWHNNTAERALRHVTTQQRISLFFHEHPTHHYLRLLSIRQSLKFQDKSFFRFLFSKEKNIDNAK